MKCKGGGSYFYKYKKYRPLEIEKKDFQLIHFRKSLFFIYAFLQKMLNVSSEHSFKEYRCLKNVIHQTNSKNEWLLLSASFTLFLRGLILRPTERV